MPVSALRPVAPFPKIWGWSRSLATRNSRSSRTKPMKMFDPHIHMTSRTTDDYQAMADAGIKAIIEPSFWLGQPRTGVDTFKDYFNSLIGWERFRSSQFGIKHYCTIGLNSKEANNEKLAEAVMEVLP